MKRIFAVTLLSAAIIGFSCESPSDPYNIRNATFSEENITSIPESVPVNSIYPCTLKVSLPELIDSFAVYRTPVAGEPEKITGGVPGEDPLLVFNLHFDGTVSYALDIYLYKEDLVDTLHHEVSVFATAPELPSGESRVNATPDDDSVTLKFVAEDPDSNLLGWIALMDGRFHSRGEMLASERANAVVTIKLPHGILLTLHDTLTIFTFTVFDQDSQYSPAALCTLMVTDTLFPSVVLLPPLDDSGYVIAALPDTFAIVVRDNWGVDTVKLGERYLAAAEGKDTISFVVNKLDTGITSDLLVAWDRAGNRSSVEVVLAYSGPRIFPPQITPVIQQIDEGERFDTVYLDKIVTITDTTATYTEEALVWSIETVRVDSGLVMHFDSLQRFLYIEAPVGELLYDRSAVYALTVSDPNGISSQLNGVTFIMHEINDPPVITLKGQRKVYSTSFDTLLLDTCGSDPEGNTQLRWQIEKGEYFYPQYLSSIYCPGTGDKGTLPGKCIERYDNNRVRILPDTAAISAKNSKNVNDTLLFTLKSIVPGDTTLVVKRVPFSWYQFGVVIDTLPFKLQ